MNHYTRILIIVAALSAATIVTCTKAADGKNVARPKNFIFFGRERERIAESTFWGTQEPYYTNDVLPFIRNLAKGDVH